jgi:hypothetical protein
LSWEGRTSWRNELLSPFANELNEDGADGSDTPSLGSGINSSEGRPGGKRLAKGRYL